MGEVKETRGCTAFWPSSWTGESTWDGASWEAQARRGRPGALVVTPSLRVKRQAEEGVCMEMLPWSGHCRGHLGDRTQKRG